MFRRSLVKRAEWWEFQPTAEHRSLVLMLYKVTLKELLNFKSVRKRSLIAHCRLTYRKRAKATEKVLIDECIEEARRAVYVLDKHNQMAKTGNFEFDSMYLPKDTGQDVATFMEEVYEPSVGKQQYQRSDVVPGKEHLHQAEHAERAKKIHENMFKSPIREEDKVFRPPAPPNM